MFFLGGGGGWGGGVGAVAVEFDLLAISQPCAIHQPHNPTPPFPLNSPPPQKRTSMKLSPASNAYDSCSCASASVFCLPHVIVPRQQTETSRSEPPVPFYGGGGVG